MNITQLLAKVNHIKAKHDLAVSKLADEKKQFKQALLDQEAAEQAREIVQFVSEQIQQQAHQKIAGIVTRCLHTVFGDDAYEFKIIFEQKRGKTEARLVFTRDNAEIDPLTASGGGVIDVAAFALRLTCLILSQPLRRRLLILDEPFRFLSIDYHPAMRQLLISLAEEMDMQFIIVTHTQGLCIGKVVEI